MNIITILIISFVISQISMFATELYVHRYLAHRSFWLHPVVALPLHLWISVFIGINVRKWAAIHRIHHSHADTPDDPHSPHNEGFIRVFLGSFYFPYVAKNKDIVISQTSDYKPDVIDKIPFIGYRGISGFLIMSLLFGWTDGFIVTILHLLFYLMLFGLLNTLGHNNEEANPKAGHAKNVVWLAPFTAGEALHKNHHSNPGKARFDILRGEIDPAWWVISLLCKIKLANIPVLQKKL
jgi:stearoyl-CoA desaturase (delta-9 desaturase)